MAGSHFNCPFLIGMGMPGIGEMLILLIIALWVEPVFAGPAGTTGALPWADELSRFGASHSWLRLP